MGSWSDTVTLIELTPSDAENGQEEKNRRDVFCNELSVWNSEFYNSLLEGHTARVKLEIHAFEYGGEEQAEYKNRRYKIQRTESAQGETLYLTLSDLMPLGGAI